MMYCENCGQCRFISEDMFFEKRWTSGWETSSVDDSGEHYDYIDSEISDSEHANHECPHCEGEDIILDWDGSNEDAVFVRNEYIERQQEHRANLTRHQQERDQAYKAKDPLREWDVVENV